MCPLIPAPQAAMDIMEFLIELIKKEPETTGGPAAKEHAEDTIMFALNMIHTALLTLVPSSSYHPVNCRILPCRRLSSTLPSSLFCPSLHTSPHLPRVRS